MSASGGSPTVTTDEVAELTEALRLARRELKLVRGQQESSLETLQRVRRQRAALRDQAQACAEALAGLLAERYWQGEGGRLARIGRTRRTPEQELVAEVEAAEEFDAAWYLRHNLDAVADLVSPAAHYVRVGGAVGRDPGPAFDTARYLHRYPEARDASVPPLIHFLRAPRG